METIQAAEEQLVSFVVGGEVFGIDILKVQEIIRPTQITSIPNASRLVEGVINLRGRIIPIVSLRRRFGLPDASDEQHESRIIVVDLERRVVGFRVDGVRQVLAVDGAQSEPPPELSSGAGADYVRGVAKLEDGLLLLLDLERVLAQER